MKVLVITSGGADSTTALYWAKKNKRFSEVEAVFFDYGSRQNHTEKYYIKKQCKELGVKLNIIDTKSIFKNYSSLLLDKSSEIPSEDYDKDNISKLVVPFRNGVFLSLCAGLAESCGASYIILGNHSGDHEIYPDCRDDFIKTIKKAIYLGTGGKVEVLSPFCNITKKEIIKKGENLNVKYELTYSCYTGNKIHCGECPTCRERKEAFKLNNIIDKTKYER